MQDKSDRGLISCVGKFFKPLDNVRKVASLEINIQLYNFYLIDFLRSFKLLLVYCTVCYKLSMSIMFTIFDVSIQEKRANSSLCFELIPQQMSKSKKEVHGPVPAYK